MSVPEPLCSDPFAEIAMGVLLARVERSAGELVRLRAHLLGERMAGDPSGSDLTDACADLELQGWLFGFVSGELGSDVLFERRERQGLKLALGLVSEMLAREGVELRIGVLPALDTTDPRANGICAAVARCVHAAHAFGAAPPWSFERRGGTTCLRFAGTPSEGLRSALLRAALRLEGSRLHGGQDAIELEFPAGSLVWP